MYRLRFRKSAAGFLILFIGAFCLSFLKLNPFNSSTNFDLPVLPIIAGQLLVPLLFAFTQFRGCPLLQIVGGSLSVFALIGALAIVGNATADQMVFIQQNALLHFNGVQLGVVNILGLISAANILQAEKMSSFADTRVAEAQLDRLKHAKVDPETQAKWEKAAAHADQQAEGRSLRSTMTNLKAISLTEPGQELRPQIRETPKNISENRSDTGSGGLAGLLDRMEEPAQAPKETETFAFGNRDNTPPVQDSGDLGGFSLAAALDSQADAPDLAPAAETELPEMFTAPEQPVQDLSSEPTSEPIPAPELVFEPTPDPAPQLVESEPVFEPVPEPVIEPQPVFEPAPEPIIEPQPPAAEAPKFQATSQSRAAEAPPVDPASIHPINDDQQAIKPSATANRLAAMKRRNTSTFTKLQSLSAASPDALQTPPPATGPDDSLKSLLDRLDDGKIEEPAQPLTPPVEIILDFVFKDESTETQSNISGHSSISDRLDTVAAPDVVQDKSQDQDNVVAPQEHQQETPEQVQPVQEKHQQEEQDEENQEESGSLFTESLSEDLDKVFSDLTEQDQLEVTPETLKKFKSSEEEENEKAELDKAPELELEPELESEIESEIEESGSLFTESLGEDLDKVFSDLTEQDQFDVTPETLKKVKGVDEAQESEEAEDSGSLFTESLGEDLDKVFGELTEQNQLEVTPETLKKLKNSDDVKTSDSPRATGEMPAMTIQEAEHLSKAETDKDKEDGPKKPKYKEVKEFGRLSSRSAAAPKTSGETVGSMKTIGKLLLDVQAVENIIKAGETKKIGANLSTAKIISASRGEGIKNILTTIDTYEGVSGSLIVGHDGLVISSTVAGNYDKDMLGALSTALLSTSNLATKKLEIGKLRQMVLLTDLGPQASPRHKTTVLTDVEVGILAVFVEETHLDKIDGLLDIIHNTVHGG